MDKVDRNKDQLLQIFEFCDKLPVKFQFEIFFENFFITSKVPSRNFKGSLWGWFYAVMFISAVIGKIEPFVTRVTRKGATVNKFMV